MASVRAVASDTSDDGGAVAALQRGDYAAALVAAERAAELDRSPEALQMLGRLYMMDDRTFDAVRCWEEAFAALRRAGRTHDAARCAIDIARAYGAALGQESVGNGWITQARRLLEQVGPCVDWGYLELVIMACNRPNIDELIAGAQRALEIANEFGDTDLEAQALADWGLGLVTAGRIGEGFGLLDASLASVSAGAVGHVASGLCYCSMLSACDRTGDVRRAEQWASVVDGFLARISDKPRPLHIHCRLTYGSLLMSVGRWAEAEALLVEALGKPDTPSIAHRATTSSYLARLRVEQGRLAEAEALLVPFEDRDSSSLPLARLHARRGELDQAAALLQRTVAELIGDALRVAPLLMQLIEIEIARGDVDAAGRALAELERRAEPVDGAHLTADVARGRARVAAARGDRDQALAHFAEAKRAFDAADRPVQVGEVRLELAELLAASSDLPGDRALAIAESRAALACFDRVGAVPLRDRAAELLRRLGEIPPRTSAGGSGAALTDLTQRERDVLTLIAEGLTNPQIAERLYISPKTAEHHVGRLLAKLGVRNRAEAAALYERARTR
jgi:DNA-binding CsgD family transcriptional regulator